MSLRRKAAIALSLVGLLFVGAAAFVRLLFPDPTEANKQLREFAAGLKPGLSRAEVLMLAGRYPKLQAFGDGRVIVTTPMRFFADNWRALVEFDASDRILRVGFGTLDYAPLEPTYPAPEAMPKNACFSTLEACQKPWFDCQSPVPGPPTTEAKAPTSGCGG